MKTTRLIFFIFIVVLLCAVQQGFGATVAYWNFEDGTPGESFYNEGGSVDLQNGYVISGEDDVNTGYFSQRGDGPGDTGISADFSGTNQGCITTNTTLNTWSPSVWTIECSVVLDDLGVWESFIGRDGNSFDIAADFYLQKIDTGAFRINILTVGPSGGDPVRYTLDSDFNPVAGQWYHLAVVSDGTNLTMYADQLDGNGYQQVGTLAMSGTQSENKLIIPDTGSFHWTFGRSYFDGNPVDFIDGRIDDVRFSDTALTPDQFLHDLNDLGSPAPADGEPNVWIDPLLEWGFVNPGVTADSFDVYLSDDLNDVDPGLSPSLYTHTSNQYLQVTGLSRSTTYYWRIDPNVGGNVDTGAVWLFTTVGNDVVIKGQPRGAVAASGTTAEISILAYNVDSYKWYKEGSGTVLSTTDTLSISNVGLSDEGYYYCDVCDVSANSLTSDSAGVWVKRLVGHWKFENNPNDSVQDTVPGAPVHNAVLVDPCSGTGDGIINYVTPGIDGYCMEVNFPADGEHLQVADADFFNYWPLGYTSSCWTKMSVPDSGWGVTVSKFDTFGWGVASGGFRAAFMGWAANIDAGGATVDQWVMLTSTFDADANEFSLYVNGVQLYDESGQSTTVNAVVPPEGGIPGNVAPVRIGTDNGDNGLQGLVDDVRLYDYPLSKVEVAQLYQAFIPGSQCVQPPAFDFDDDCKVTLADYAIFAEDWFKCNIYPDCLP